MRVPTATLSLGPDHADLRRIRPWLDRLLPTSDDHTRGRIELAINELAANCLDHAGVPDPGLQLSGRLRPTGFTVELRDRGRPAELPDIQDLAPHPRIGGYGLVIVQQLAASLSHVRVGQENVWHVEFELDPPTGGDPSIGDVAAEA